MVTVSLIKQVQLLELLGSPYQGPGWFKNHIYMCPGSQLPREQASENVLEKKWVK